MATLTQSRMLISKMDESSLRSHRHRGCSCIGAYVQLHLHLLFPNFMIYIEDLCFQRSYVSGEKCMFPMSHAINWSLPYLKVKELKFLSE